MLAAQLSKCHFCFENPDIAKHLIIAIGLKVAKGGEIQDTKTLNLSRNVVSMQVYVDVSRFSPCAINFFRNKNICCGLKKCSALIGWFAWRGSNMAAFVAWQVVSLMKNEQQRQSRPALYFSQHFSSTRNKCFCCGPSWSRKVKNGKHGQKLATKQCCGTSWGFFVSRISPP